MIIAHPVQKIDPSQIGKDKPFQFLQEGGAIRVRVHLPGDEVITEGEMALPMYVVNENSAKGYPIDPGEPIDVVLRADLPLTGGTVVPVYLVEHGRGIQVQGNQASKVQGRGDQASDPQRGLQDWAWSAEGLSGDSSDMGGEASILPADLSTLGQ